MKKKSKTIVLFVMYVGPLIRKTVTRWYSVTAAIFVYIKPVMELQVYLLVHGFAEHALLGVSQNASFVLIKEEQ